MVVCCEMVSEYMYTSELYKSKSSVVFLKQMLICLPKIKLLRHLSHAAIPRLSSKFPPKEPSVRDPAFFPHRYPPNTKISPDAQRLSSLAYPSSTTFPVHLVWNKAQWSLPAGFRTKYFTVPSLAINVLPLSTPLHHPFLLFSSGFRRNQLLMFQQKS